MKYNSLQYKRTKIITLVYKRSDYVYDIIKPYIATKGHSIYKLHKWLQDLISLYIVFRKLDLFKALKEQKEIYQCQSPKT